MAVRFFTTPISKSCTTKPVCWTCLGSGQPARLQRPSPAGATWTRVFPSCSRERLVKVPQPVPRARFLSSFLSNSTPLGLSTRWPFVSAQAFTSLLNPNRQRDSEIFTHLPTSQTRVGRTLCVPVTVNKGQVRKGRKTAVLDLPRHLVKISIFLQPEQ